MIGEECEACNQNQKVMLNLLSHSWPDFWKPAQKRKHRCVVVLPAYPRNRMEQTLHGPRLVRWFGIQAKKCPKTQESADYRACKSTYPNLVSRHHENANNLIFDPWLPSWSSRQDDKGCSRMWAKESQSSVTDSGQIGFKSSHLTTINQTHDPLQNWRIIATWRFPPNTIFVVVVQNSSLMPSEFSLRCRDEFVYMLYTRAKQVRVE